MPEVRCTCGRLLPFKPEQAGKRAKCPACSAIIRLPVAEQREMSAAEAPPGPEAGLRLQDLPPPTLEPAPAPPLTELPGGRLEFVEERAATFWDVIPQAFTYPLIGDGLGAWLGGVMLFALAECIVWLARFFPLRQFGFAIGVAVYIFLTAFVLGYLLDVITHSARGEPGLPEWPDITDCWDDAIRPLLLVFALSVISFAPCLIYMAVRWEEVNWSLVHVLAVCGLLYWPMALLCVALTDDVAGLIPVIVLRAIFSLPVRYLVTCAIVFIAFEAGVTGRGLVTRYLPVAILGPLLQMAVILYFLFVAARSLGLLAYTAGGRLDWMTGRG